VHDELVLSADAREIRVRQKEYSCPFDAASPKLIRETEL
jgi:hypothetical protein